MGVEQTHQGQKVIFDRKVIAAVKTLSGKALDLNLAADIYIARRELGCDDLRRQFDAIVTLATLPPYWAQEIWDDLGGLSLTYEATDYAQQAEACR